MPRGMHNAWTDEQIALLLELRDDEAMEWPEIAKEIGRAPQSCETKYNSIKMRERAEQRIRPAFRMVPNSALIDRDRRDAAREQQSITGSVFGDPPPGFSALDRRRACQHTAIAAASRGDIAKVPVMIVDAKTLKERADAFVSQNRDRLALTAGHMHYAARAAGEEIAVAVAQACEKAGVRILKSSPGATGEYRVGDTFAVGIISKIVAKIGAHQGGKVLKVLVDAKRAPLAAHEIAAVYQLLFEPEFKGKVDPFDLVTVIRSKSVNDWRAAAWKLSAEGLSQRQMIAQAIFRAMKRRPANA